ncbi:AAEL010191-PA [Aedes aegypti]|uniref:AAEL010191-PA n=1 Tax=Aedes aegypti TaxID=7159 RepID=Q16TM7_AEDAE|nr:AAEL010191-PA [Aedes aegypti]
MNITIFGSGFEQMLQLLGVHGGLRQLVPNGALYRRRNHILANFLPEKFYLPVKGMTGERERERGHHTSSRVHKPNAADHQIAVALAVLHEHQQQFECRFHHQSILGCNQRVKPLDRGRMLHDTVHAIHVQHHLPQRPQDVVLVILIRLIADLHQAIKPSQCDEAMDQILIFLEDLLQRK